MLIKSGMSGRLNRAVDVVMWIFILALCVFLDVEFWSVKFQLLRWRLDLCIATAFFVGAVLIGALSIGLIRRREWLMFPASTLIIGWLAKSTELDVEYMFMHFLGQPLCLDLLLVASLVVRRPGEAVLESLDGFWRRYAKAVQRCLGLGERFGALCVRPPADRTGAVDFG